MTRRTSVSAFNEIKAEGLLSDLKFAVYELLFQSGPLTGSQVHQSLSRGRSDAGGTYTSRLSELRRLGVIAEVGERPCPLTGRKAILWDVTDRLPTRFDKPKKIKCKACHGKGFFVSEQARLL